LNIVHSILTTNRFPQSNYNSNIKDHHNRYNNSNNNNNNNNENVWNIARITQMWHRDTRWAHAVGKMAPIDLLDAGLPKTFNVYKTRYLRSAIKWGVPVHASFVYLRTFSVVTWDSLDAFTYYSNDHCCTLSEFLSWRHTEQGTKIVEEHHQFLKARFYRW
jgi:hypothetical protein